MIGKQKERLPDLLPDTPVFIVELGVVHHDDVSATHSQQEGQREDRGFLVMAKKDVGTFHWGQSCQNASCPGKKGSRHSVREYGSLLEGTRIGYLPCVGFAGRTEFNPDDRSAIPEMRVDGIETIDVVWAEVVPEKTNDSLV